MRMAPLTWFGLALAGLGWIAVLAGPWLTLLAHDLAALPRPDIVGSPLILTGLGLAILGALEAGFGALDRFFQAALLRSAASAMRPAPPPRPAPADEVVVEATVVDKDAIVERGEMNGRLYVVFGDGSIEVETLLGLRRFDTIAEARRFVG